MVPSMNTRALPYIMGALCIIPVGGTLYRSAEIVLTGHWAFEFSPEMVDRLPLFIHGIAMLAFLVGGAVQFSARIRTQRPQLHRRLGRVAGMGAILGGLSGIWMTLLHLEISTPLLLAGRLLFGSAMAGFAVLAIHAAMQRRVQDHRAWIIRSYAIAFNAASFPVFYLPVVLIVGEPSPLLDDTFQVAGWMLNLSIAEKFFINRPTRKGVPA